MEFHRTCRGVINLAATATVETIIPSIDVDTVLTINTALALTAYKRWNGLIP